MAGLVQYNFTIDDTSPVLTYAPYADFNGATGQGDGLQNGWQTWYSASGYLSSSEGPSPLGESFHLTSLPEASVSLSFYGTGVVLYGLTNSSYDVVFDGSLVPNTSLSQGVFFSVSDAEPGTHNVSLIAKPDGEDQILSFNRALVNSVVNTTSPTPAALTVDNQNTSAIWYTGDWTTSKVVSDVPSSGTPTPFHSTTASGASAALNFTGRAVALYGSSTTNHGPYSVTLDGVRQIFNGSSQWLLGNILLFYQDGLDENSTHSLNLTNLNDGDALTLNSVQITQFSSASGVSVNSGVTSGVSRVGAIVGPLIAFIVLAGVISLYIWTKRRDKRNPKKPERRSSITSSIFLPQRFRRKYNNREDPITPYVLDFRRSSNIGIRSSVASSALSVPRWDRARLNENIHGEKSLPLPDIGIQPSEGTQQETPPFIPVTYLPSEADEPRSGFTRTSGSPPAPAYPPPARPPISSSGRESSVRSDDPSLIKRILELVTQRIDHRPSSTNISRNKSSDRLPPYVENV
ncbi:hypothetical protein ACEPAI_507 [Sanghuangporus weigelae]